MLSRRKQTNKKYKKETKDVWHGSLMTSEARHATQYFNYSIEKSMHKFNAIAVFKNRTIFQKPLFL